MKIFAIRDETLPRDTLIGYLVYYEDPKAFYVELADGLDPWEAPPIFSAFVKRGDYSIDSYWSRRWVQSRIVPRDRQNIGQILRENHLGEYDEFSLLVIATGRCAQDDFYLEDVSPEPLPGLLARRWLTKITDVVPLETPKLLVFFRDSAARVVDVKAIAPPACVPHLAMQQRFNAVEVQPDGYGVYWNDRAALPHQVLHANGVEVPLSLRDFHRYVQTRVVSAPEACSILDCSGQDIDDLTRGNKLHPIRADTTNKLFSKAEIMQRKQNE